MSEMLKTIQAILKKYNGNVMSALDEMSPLQRAVLMQSLPEDLAEKVGQSIEQIYRTKKENKLDFIKFHGQQQSAYDCKKKFQFCTTGNRGGKTTLMVAKGLNIIRGKHPYWCEKVLGEHWAPPLNGWLVGASSELTSSVLAAKVIEWAPKGMIKSMPNKDKPFFDFRDPPGRLWLKADEQGCDKFRGAAIHFALIDEECSRPVFNETMWRILDFSGFIMNVFTPQNGLTYIYHEYYLKRQAQAKLIDFFEWMTDDNPHISREQIEATADLCDEDELEARRFGKWVNLAGKPYFGREALEYIRKNQMCNPVYSTQDIFAVGQRRAS